MTIASTSHLPHLPHRHRVALATIGVAVVVLAGCTRPDDPQVQITGRNNIGTPSTGATVAPATGTTVPPRPPTTGSVTAGANDVVITGYEFVPAELDVAAGTTVTWNNAETDPPVDHWVKSSPGQAPLIDSDTLSAGKSYSQTFNQPGEYDYYCNIHNFMKGKLVVR
jgi:plastocyanin